MSFKYDGVERWESETAPGFYLTRKGGKFQVHGPDGPVGKPILTFPEAAAAATLMAKNDAKPPLYEADLLWGEEPPVRVADDEEPSSE